MSPQPMELHLTIDGVLKVIAIEPSERLSTVLRREGYASVKHGCYSGDCGSCTVLLRGKPVVSCLTLAAQAQGAEVMTAEGLAHGERLHPLQKAFLEEGAVQCGFCIPGMLMSALALLAHNADPSEAQVRKAIAGNLCRCTGYDQPVKAILNAAKAMQGKAK